MKRKTVLPLCCALLLLPFTASILSDQQVVPPPQLAPKRSADTAPPEFPESALPDHLLYEIFFNHLDYFHKRAVQEKDQGRDSARFREFLPSKVQLAPHEVPGVEEVAFACLGEARELDRQAREIIDQARADQCAKGFSRSDPPLAPPSLLTLQTERDQVFLQGREQLSNSLGETRVSHLEVRVRQLMERTGSPIGRGLR